MMTATISKETSGDYRFYRFYRSIDDRKSQKKNEEEVTNFLE